MNKKILLLALITLMPSSVLSAQKESINIEKLFPKSLEDFNPFKPQIPIKKVEPKKTVKETKPPKKSKITRPIPVQQPKKTKITKNVPPPKEFKKPKTTLPKLTVNGLVWDSDRPQAIINGQIVEIGDEINSVSIIDIHRAGVDISFNEKILTIEP